MRKVFFAALAVVVLSKSYAQSTPSDKQILDSLLQNDDILKKINDFDKPESEFKVNIGFGNNLYGNQNKAVASLQNSDIFVISPSVAYTHKSGFGINFTGDMLNQNSSTGFYQYTLTPSYEYTTGKTIDVSLYYTRYFKKDVSNAETSPFDNEFYSTFVYKKTWLKPGVALGYSNGNYDETVKVDTSVKVGNQKVPVKYIDSAAIKIFSFSASLTVEHEFDFDNVFAKNDGISFTPQLFLITGINQYIVSHTSSDADFNAYSKKLLKKIKNFESQTGKQKYEPQSVGMNLDFTYSVGIFFIEPTLYLNYYLPKTTGNRFSQIYMINAGITF